MGSEGAFLFGSICEVVRLAGLALEFGCEGGVIIQGNVGEEAVAVAKGDQCFQASFEGRGVAGRIKAGGLCGLVHFPNGLVCQRDEQGLAAGEVPVQRGAADTGMIGNLAERDTRIAA